MPQYDFVVLDIVVDATLASYSYRWRPLLILELSQRSYMTHSIQPGYNEWLLLSNAKMWHCGAICWTIVAICIGLLIIIVAASVAAGIAVRNYFVRKRLSKGPNKIVLSASDFVFPVDSRRVDEGIEAMLCCWLQQLQEFGGPEVDKPDLLKGSIGSLKNLGFVIPGAAAAGNGSAAPAGTAGASTSLTVNGKSSSAAAGSLARHIPAHLDMRARYNGDLVQLKEIQLNGSAELRSKAMDLLVMAHGLRHENINPLVGWLADPNRTALVFDYCSRGSLQDVLIMDEIKLDWSFRLSLLTDLVRGMRYLHASPLRVHGALTSRNCVVDARWVLKITDYGLNAFYESQGLQPLPRNAKDLLWTAPELLRSMKTTQQQQQHHHHHHQHGRVQLGTQLGDVYSFGIIMQEVVVRGEPYCMLSLAPDDIIAKIRKPPPLIRPSVSKGAAPPEAINIMRQCWAEQPDMRPDFNSVYERFKMLNHGRKVNFVDTMFQMLEKYSNNLEELIRERTEQLDIERKKTEQLLNRMLPSSVAEKLKMGLAVDPEEFSDVTIYFSDIVGFTTIAAHCSPVQVVDLLNDLYTIFDATINAYNVYKVETIGDAYMVVSGLPVKIPDHAEQIADMALDLLHQSGRFNVKHLPGVPLQLRIGLHTGPCCAGVVGLTMPRYCLFGDTVNTASRMESTGSSWRIHMSQETRDRLEARGGYSIEPRGLIDIKGKGMMSTFWLLGKKGFDKPLPAPPPIGLDESLIRNSITLKAQANKSRTSTNPSSSQSSSLAGESVEVKVEITPPSNADMCSSNLPNSYSLDSNSTNTISPNATLCPEFPTKTPTSTSPQSRKLSELTPDSLLNPNSFNRLPSSTGGSSSRLYKKIEEMMDLSSPYNHYKCLSPSESNLTQFYDGKYLYGNAGGAGAASTSGTGSGGCSVSGSTSKFDSKPGSSRLLRRQFSLDRDDQATRAEQQHQHQHQLSLQASNYVALLQSSKQSMLEIPMLQDTSRSPKGTLSRNHKQNSTSVAQDLEKIEEIPLSPASSQHHSSLDSNLNRSPPSTLEAQSPQQPPLHQLSPPLLSAPTSPAPSRSLNGHQVHSRRNSNNNNNNNNSSTNSDSSTNTQQSSRAGQELTLNVEQLLSR
ncbi:retinal guanylyl cyclase 2 isoform X1 [Drosophila busckii]|nr:retinal guanylyl cyclase 2 isoform X1 [Drosophila busckii]